VLRLTCNVEACAISQARRAERRVLSLSREGGDCGGFWTQGNEIAIGRRMRFRKAEELLHGDKEVEMGGWEV